MTPEERARIERELQENGFITIDDVPFSVKQMALLNYHKLDELAATVKEVRDAILQMPARFVSCEDMDKYKGSVRTTVATLAASIIGVLALVVSVLVR